LEWYAPSDPSSNLQTFRQLPNCQQLETRRFSQRRTLNGVRPIKVFIAFQFNFFLSPPTSTGVLITDLLQWLNN
jgi:hypothetical protein